MTDPRPFERLSDDELGVALRELGRALALPGRTTSLTPSTASAAGTGGVPPDPARRARDRIEADEIRPGDHPAGRPTVLAGWTSGGLRRPARRGLLFGLAAVLSIAAVAGAIGFGLPGIRIVFGPPASPAVTGSSGASASPSPTIAPTRTPTPTRGPLGSGLGLGTALAIADAGSAAGITLRLPPDPPFGDPLTAWNLDGRISLVWAASPTLPVLREPGIGLILGQFRGSINPGYFEKFLGPDTTIDPVVVNGESGWWISGEPHDLIFVSPGGDPVLDSHRIVGDTLIWTAGDITYRLESGLGRDAAIRLAESLR